MIFEDDIEPTCISVGERDGFTYPLFGICRLVTQGLELSELTPHPKRWEEGKRHQKRVLHHSSISIAPLYMYPNIYTVGVALRLRPLAIKGEQKDKIGGSGGVQYRHLLSEGFGNEGSPKGSFRDSVPTWKSRTAVRAWTSSVGGPCVRCHVPQHAGTLSTIAQSWATHDWFHFAFPISIIDDVGFCCDTVPKTRRENAEIASPGRPG